MTRPPALAVRGWTRAQGLPAAHIHDLALTEDGYLWAAAAAKLYRNNGRNFTALPLPAEEPKATGNDADGLSQLVSLHGSLDGALWAATTGRTVFQVEALGVRPWLLPELPGLEGHRCFASAPDGALWVTAGEWLFRKQAQGFVAVARSEGMPLRRCAVAPDGRVWVIGSGGLRVLVDKALAPSGDRKAASSGDYRDLLWTPDGTLWLAADDEVVEFPPGATAPRDHGVRVGGRGAELRRLLRDCRGRLWAVGARSVHCWTGRSFWEVGLALDELQGQVLGAGVDQEGCLWLAFDQGGIAQLVPTPARWYNPLSPAELARRGLSAAGDSAVVADHAGTIWLANTWGGLAYAGANEKWQPITNFTGVAAEPGPPRRAFRTLAAARPGGLWAGTADGRLYRATTNQAVVVPETSLTGKGLIAALLEDRSGGVWVARAYGGLRRIDPGHTGAPTIDLALPDRGVHRLYEAADGTIWAGGDRIWRIHDGRFEAIPVRGQSGAVGVAGFWEDQRGDLWMAGRATGFSVLKAGVFQPVGRAHLRAEGVLAGPVPDHGGRLWVIDGHGLCWTTPEALSAAAAAPASVLRMETVPLAAPSQPRLFESPGAPELGVDGRGVLWVATTMGALLIDTAQVKTNARPPRLHVSGIRADGQRVRRTAVPDLPAGTKRLEVDFDVLAFVQPEAVQVAARLGGEAAEWRNVTGERSVVWADPPPGRHELQLRAFFPHQEHLAASTVLAWNQRQPWWRRWPFVAACAGILFGALSFHLWMTRRADRRQLAAIHHERERLSRELHDTVEQGLQVTALRLSALAETLAPGSDRAHLRPVLDQIRDLTLHTLTEARRAVWELLPDAAQLATVEAALEADAQRLLGGTGIGLAWSSSGQSWPLAADVAAELRRIHSEAVTNALKHAQASEITVHCQWQPEALVLEVADDGRGFLPVDTQGSGTQHLGLLGMEARATRIGAQWSLHTQPGEGTCMRVVLPRRRNPPGARRSAPAAPAARDQQAGRGP